MMAYPDGEPSDEVLVTRCKAELPHNTQSYERLVQRHMHRVYRTVYRVITNQEDAEEITQDIFFGSMLADFLGTAVTTLAGNVNIAYGRALGKIIEYALVAFVIVLAISTLGVDTTILTAVLALIVASAGIAIALTFAFGARESARNVIAGFYVRQHFQPGQQLTFDTYSGTVQSTKGAYTVLEVTAETGEPHTIALPNALLLQRAVLSQESPPDTLPSSGDQASA